MSGARRRSVGASRLGVGRIAAVAGAACSPQMTARAVAQPGNRVCPEGDAFDRNGEQRGVHCKSPRPNASTQLLPPKPNELLKYHCTRGFSAYEQIVCFLQRGIEAARCARCRASERCSIASMQMICASVIPAAPSRWPVEPLVELVGVAGAGNRVDAHTALSSVASWPWGWPCRAD